MNDLVLTINSAILAELCRRHLSEEELSVTVWACSENPERVAEFFNAVRDRAKGGIGGAEMAKLFLESCRKSLNPAAGVA